MVSLVEWRPEGRGRQPSLRACPEKVARLFRRGMIQAFQSVRTLPDHAKCVIGMRCASAAACPSKTLAGSAAARACSFPEGQVMAVGSIGEHDLGRQEPGTLSPSRRSRMRFAPRSTSASPRTCAEADDLARAKAVDGLPPVTLEIGAGFVGRNRGIFVLAAEEMTIDYCCG